MTDHLNHIILITKYLTKEASQEELRSFESWMNADKANKKIFDEYEKAWKDAEHVKTYLIINTDDEWKKFQSILKEKNIPFSEKKPAVRSFLYYSARVAAVMIIGILTGLGIYFLTDKMNKVQLITQAGSKEVQLNDGSVVTLNANTKLKYPLHFRGRSRKVTLRGEAYFSVHPDQTKPFIIDMGDAKVEVVGTSFNIKAYGKSNNIEVTVNSGTVVFSGSDNEKIILKAGEKGIYFKNLNQLTKLNNDNFNYLSWKTKKLIFQNNSLSDIVNTLNDVYHANIVLSDEHLIKCRVTSSFDNQTLDEVLSVLKATLDLKICKTESSILISGEGC